jgi:FkbM family methyltransferase
MHQVKGVVHVGAHFGEEIPAYIDAGFTPSQIICFEPNPWAFAILAESFPHVRVSAMALGDKDGELDLWIPGHLHGEGDDTQSASFLRADRNSPYMWGDRDREGRSVRVAMWRFDSWTDGPVADTLVIDVQGFEMQVLRGFGERLRDFDYITVECSEVPIYLGGAPAKEVVSYLAGAGFQQDSPILDHGDIKFCR